MSSNMLVTSYLRSGDECYDVTRLQSFLQVLKAKGYYVHGSDWRDILHVRLHTLYGSPRPLSTNAAKINPASLFIPTISQTLINDVDEFVQAKQKALNIRIHAASKEEGRKDFECKFSLYPQEGIIYVSVADYREF